MSPKCSVCVHPNRAAIEQAIATGDSDIAISRAFSIPSRPITIHRMKHMPLSPSRMAPGERAAYESKLREINISSKLERLRKLQQTADRLEAMFSARAAELSNLTAGDTGLIYLRSKGVGSGAQFQLIQEAVFDSSAVAEYRAVLKQAAEEMGQWDPAGTADRADAQQQGGGVTIHQVVQGSVQQAVLADPRPGSKQPSIAPAQMPTIRALSEALPRDSTHSLVRESLPAIDPEPEE